MQHVRIPLALLLMKIHFLKKSQSLMNAGMSYSLQTLF